MNRKQLIEQAIVVANNGLLPYPVPYSQVDPIKLPITAGSLKNSGYIEVLYRWLHIPTRKSGMTYLWVLKRQHAFELVGYWNTIGGDMWKYSLRLN